MGNLQCPAEDAAALASVARDICPFPYYDPNPLFLNMMSLNSSVHLRDHYKKVQSSLEPKQLEDFTQSLRRTFGREGKVIFGGVGVVALSLAVLFDTLAEQVRGERVPDTGLIPDLFPRDPRGFYPPQLYTISSFLRLVPHIANNPVRMREETERYLKRLDQEENARDRNRRNEAIIGVNDVLSDFFHNGLRIHLTRLNNSALESETLDSVPSTNSTLADGGHIVKTRKKRIPPPENVMDINLNCDPARASRVFLDKVQNPLIQEAFRSCNPRNIPKTWLHFVARLAWLDAINNPMFDYNHNRPLWIAQREDFDLKAHALGNWAA